MSLDLRQFAKEREFPRTYLAEDADMGNLEQLKGYLGELISRKINGPEQLEAWIQDISEFSSALSEENAIRSINSNRFTDDPEVERLEREYNEVIGPELSPLWDKISRKYAKHPDRDKINMDKYFVYDRDTLNAIKLYSAKNIPLGTAESNLIQEYQKLTGGLTVNFRGEELTLPQVAQYYEDPDRSTRREAWLGVKSKLNSIRDQLDDYLDQLVAIRHQEAKNVRYKNYRDYCFQAKGRFDYTPQHCEDYLATMEQLVVPLVRKMAERRRIVMGLETLTPYDCAVDVKSRPALKPFKTAEELIEGTGRIFKRMDSDLSCWYEFMRERNLFDLESRKGKAPGGFQHDLDESRVPFIFMNAVGMNDDLFTFLHECGHALHAMLARQQEPVDYRQAPIEFCEVASMGMELMALNFLDEFYTDPEDIQRAQESTLQGVIEVLPWVAQVDAFQHWLYLNPKHTRTQRREYWLELEERLGVPLDQSEFDGPTGFGWQRQRHIFKYPFYYIEYGIAQIGALQLWETYQRDPEKALQGYKAGLSLGGSRPLPELFETAGLKFDFGSETMKPLVQSLYQALS